MEVKIISVLWKITHAARTVTRYTSVIIRHAMDTRLFAYPNPIPMLFASIRRIIAALVSVDILLPEETKKKNQCLKRMLYV
mmetsp:Transcript_19400/g.54064  ORF Transcript_19400/g.54064 Transcript_19400/m.54064 type:complete len:81 (-) Transcript_19400:57-299(-)